jgi:N-acetylmuramoyl-L-alanine amidase
LVLCVVVVLVALEATVGWAAVRSAWVIPATVHVRKAPSTDAPIVAEATRGTKVWVVKFRGGWAGLKLPSGTWGWVREDLLQFSADQGRSIAADAGGSSSGHHPPVWITVDGANVRSGPGLGYSRFGSLPSGTKLYVLENRGDWLRCKTPGGSGWLASSVVTSDASQGHRLSHNRVVDPPKVFVDSEAVNLRTHPNTDADIKARLVEGQTAWVLETRPDWAKVRVQDGVSGWMMRKYLKTPSSGSGSSSSASSGPAGFPNPSGDHKFRTLTAWVDEDSTNVHDGPGADQDVKFQLKQGQKVTVVALQDQWCQIRTGGGDTGWVAGWVVSFSPPSSETDSSELAKLGWVTRPLINLRSGPGENYPRTGTLTLSTQVYIVAKQGDWYKVAMDNHEIGWVGTWLIDTVGDRVNRGDTGSTPAPSGPAPQLASASGEGGSEMGRAIVKTAMQQLGADYVHGAASPGEGFDCSGLVSWVLEQHGISAARTCEDLFRQGRPVSRDNLEPGDIVFFEHTYRPGISHVGIYLGAGKFIHAANPGTGVKITDLDESYYASRYVGARRMH